jgi:hypothetical protein
LVLDVGLHPIEVLGSETDHAVSGLPLQHLLALPDLLVDIV